MNRHEEKRRRMWAFYYLAGALMVTTVVLAIMAIWTSGMTGNRLGGTAAITMGVAMLSAIIGMANS